VKNYKSLEAMNLSAGGETIKIREANGLFDCFHGEREAILAIRLDSDSQNPASKFYALRGGKYSKIENIPDNIDVVFNIEGIHKKILSENSYTFLSGITIKNFPLLYNADSLQIEGNRIKLLLKNTKLFANTVDGEKPVAILYPKKEFAVVSGDKIYDKINGVPIGVDVDFQLDTFIVYLTEADTALDGLITGRHPWILKNYKKLVGIGNLMVQNERVKLDWDSWDTHSSGMDIIRNCKLTREKGTYDIGVNLANGKLCVIVDNKDLPAEDEGVNFVFNLTDGKAVALSPNNIQEIKNIPDHVKPSLKGILFLSANEVLLWQNEVFFIGSNRLVYKIFSEEKNIPLNSWDAYYPIFFHESKKICFLSPEWKRCYERGVMDYNKGNYSEAIENFNKAIKIFPLHKEAYLYRGGCYANKGELDKAIADCNEAIKIDPKFAKSYYYRALFWTMVEKKDNAVEDLTKCIESDPEFSTAYEKRGNIFVEMGKLEAAIDDFTKVIEITPNSEIAYTNRALILLYQKKLDEAIRDFNKLVDINPPPKFFLHTSEVLEEVADSYMREENYSEAEKLYRCILETREKILGFYHPKVAKALYNLRDFYQSIGKTEEAEKYEKKIQLLWEKRNN
jgi:tetratricopeptide (TPR) repeat protein